jgi:iron complex transport system permease protein
VVSAVRPWPVGGQRTPTVLAILAFGVVAAFVTSLAVGAFPISLGRIVTILAAAATPGGADAMVDQDVAVLLSIRLPRAVLAVCTGAGLAMAGAVMQGLFRNPLADPAVIGVSSGAALGAALAIVGVGVLPATVRQSAGSLLLPGAAFLAALVTTGLVYRVGRSDGASGTHAMLLAGIAFNALAFAGVGALSFAASDEQLRNLSFWTLGSLGQASRPLMIAASLVAAGGALLLWRLAPLLNALALGATEAAHLGVHVRGLERRAVVLAALVVGSLVAATGVISFVGLVAPHVVRLACGPDHRVVLPGAALFGAALMLAADAVARTVAAPAELPVGVLTTAVGAPFFLALLMRARRASGI